ncbi:hypothetical protein PanWU01x14_316340, partial [Parasponia andersonii]
LRQTINTSRISFFANPARSCSIPILLFLIVTETK